MKKLLLFCLLLGGVATFVVYLDVLGSFTSAVALAYPPSLYGALSRLVRAATFWTRFTRYNGFPLSYSFDWFILELTTFTFVVAFLYFGKRTQTGVVLGLLRAFEICAICLLPYVTYWMYVRDYEEFFMHVTDVNALQFGSGSFLGAFSNYDLFLGVWTVILSCGFAEVYLQTRHGDRASIEHQVGRFGSVVLSSFCVVGFAVAALSNYRDPAGFVVNPQGWMVSVTTWAELLLVATTLTLLVWNPIRPTLKGR